MICYNTVRNIKQVIIKMDNIEQYQKLFSERLRILRNEQGYKQEYLAEKLNISNTVMSRLENESTVPKFDVLIRLSDIFNVSIDYLIGISDNREIVKQSSQQKVTRKNTVSKSKVVKGSLVKVDEVIENPYDILSNILHHKM